MMKFTRRSLSVALATASMVGLVIAFYTLFQSEAEGVPNKFYVVAGISCVIGCVALIVAITEQREIVVYRDRKLDTDKTVQSIQEEGKSTISLETVKSAIKASANKNEVIQNGLQAICKQLEAGQGALYVIESENEKRVAVLRAGYALTVSEGHEAKYDLGEGLIGQAAASGNSLYLDEVPEGYIKIISGLGSASPRYLFISPARHNNLVIGVLEIASFTPLSLDQRKFVEEAAQLVSGELITK